MKIRCFKNHGRLTKLERLCLSSFVHHHGSLELFSYEPVANVPLGVEQISAEEIMPRSADEFRFNSVNGVEALFRWKALYELGGCFITTDVLCIRPLEFESKIVFGKKSDVECYRWGMDILIFPPRHEATEYMLNRCLHPHFPVAGDKFSHWVKKQFRRRFTHSINPVKSWKIGGEFGFQSAVDDFGLSGFAQSPPVFYPIHEARWLSPFDHTFSDDLTLLPMTRAIALNTDAARRAGFDFDREVPSDSLVGHYAAKYEKAA